MYFFNKTIPEGKLSGIPNGFVQTYNLNSPKFFNLRSQNNYLFPIKKFVYSPFSNNNGVDQSPNLFAYQPPNQ